MQGIWSALFNVFFKKTRALAKPNCELSQPLPFVHSISSFSSVPSTSNGAEELQGWPVTVWILSPQTKVKFQNPLEWKNAPFSLPPFIFAIFEALWNYFRGKARGGSSHSSCLCVVGAARTKRWGIFLQRCPPTSHASGHSQICWWCEQNGFSTVGFITGVVITSILSKQSLQINTWEQKEKESHGDRQTKMKSTTFISKGKLLQKELIFRPQQQENWEKRLKWHEANTFLIVTWRQRGPCRALRLLAQTEFHLFSGLLCLGWHFCPFLTLATGWLGRKIRPKQYLGLS